MPRGEQYRVVRAVAVGALAGRALPNPVPIGPRHTVDATDLVVGGHAGLRLSMELLHGQKEQRPLIGVLGLQCADFESRVRCAGYTGGDGAGGLTLVELIENVAIELEGKVQWVSKRCSRRKGSAKEE